MCGRYGYVNEDGELIRNRYRFPDVPDAIINYNNRNVAPAEYAPVVTKDGIQLMRFGLIPHYSPTKTKFFINARSEGKYNDDDDPNYSGKLGIMESGLWGPLVRKHRIIIPCRFFYEGPKKEKLSMPHIVFRRDCQLMSLAGINSIWTDRITGEVIESFAIITTTPMDALKFVGHHRSPVILADHEEEDWLESTDENVYVPMMNRMEDGVMNAWRVTDKMKSGRDKEFSINPVSTPFIEEDMGSIEIINSLLNIED